MGGRSYVTSLALNRSGTRQGQQLAQQGDVVVIPSARREQGSQFPVFGFRRVTAGESGGMFELHDDRPERAVLILPAKEFTADANLFA
jgi:hypothetical protein